MHNGHIRVNEEKMSKSLGNFFLIRDVLKSFDPEVLRFFMLKAHYRSPINYSDAQLEEARSGLVRLYTALAQVPTVTNIALDSNSPWVQRFTEAMNDDFNTAKVLANMFTMVNHINSFRSGAFEKETLSASTIEFLQQQFKKYLEDIFGQIFFIFILTIAAAESAIGLAIAILFYRVKGSSDLNQIPIILI